MENVALLSAAAGVATVEIVVGYANWGQYEFRLFDSAGTDLLAKVGLGVTTDQVPDIVPVAPEQPIAALNGSLLAWHVKVASYSGGEQPFSVIVKIRQNGALVGGGLVEDVGTMVNAKLVASFRRLVVLA
jgi:hypothetical protein